MRLRAITTSVLTLTTVFMSTVCVRPTRAQAEDPVLQEANNGLFGGTVWSFAAVDDDEIFAGASSGLFRSTDGGTSWVKTLNVPTPRAVGVSPGGDVFVATEQNGAFRSTDGGNSWVKLEALENLPGSFQKVALAFNHEGDVFIGSFLSIFRSSDNGDSWVDVGGGFPDQVFPSELEITQDGTIFVGSLLPGLYRSTDNGDSWVKVLSTTREVMGVTQDSAGKVFAITGEGKVYSSADGGDSWQGAGHIPNVNIFSDLKINSSGYLFVGTNDGVFRSLDGGSSWSELTADLIPEYGPMWSLAVTPNGDVFAGSDGAGIIRSEDNGETWMYANTGLTSKVVSSIVINRQHELFVGTKGAGPRFGADIFRSSDGGDSWHVVWEATTGDHIKRLFKFWV